MACKACEERRKALKAKMEQLKAWVKNPRGVPNPTSINLPSTPQVHGRPRTIAKKDIRS